MYSGNDVDISYSGNLVRRILGLPKNFGKWEGNTFLNNFDSQQMRFLESNKHSVHSSPTVPSLHTTCAYSLVGQATFPRFAATRLVGRSRLR